MLQYWSEIRRWWWYFLDDSFNFQKGSKSVLKSLQNIGQLNGWQTFTSLYLVAIVYVNQKICPWQKGLIGQVVKFYVVFRYRYSLNLMTYSTLFKNPTIWSYPFLAQFFSCFHIPFWIFRLFVCLKKDGLTNWRRSECNETRLEGE